jgi:hypothetical protein
MRNSVMGKPYMGGRHAVFKVLAAKGHLPWPPGLTAGGFAKTKDQGLQFFESSLHRIVSRNKLLDSPESRLHLPRAVGRRASERLRRRSWSRGLIEIEKYEQTPTLRAGAIERSHRCLNVPVGSKSVAEPALASYEMRSDLAETCWRAFSSPIRRAALHSDRRWGYKARAIRDAGEFRSSSVAAELGGQVAGSGVPVIQGLSRAGKRPIAVASSRVGQCQIVVN